MDSAAHVEIADYRHGPRMTGLNQIIENAIDDGFVEGSFFPKRPEIELEGFELDTQLIRHVANPDGRKVRLPGARADARELRAFHADFVIPFRSRIRKGLQLLARPRRHDLILTEHRANSIKNPA
jgi:hypothetical protein